MSYKRLLITALLSLAVAVSIMGTPAPSFASAFVGVSVTIAPPALPVYVQPPIPGPGYIWTPGYWAWDPELGYYWVPGTWVLPPAIGLLWTPGYWNWYDGAYVWFDGYWGPKVGFYGGIDYGFGYNGFGYYGGYWRGDRFYYNRTVNNINIANITTVYSSPVSNVRPAGPSFNGGTGGTTARATSTQLAAANLRRFSPTSSQMRQVTVARADPNQRVSVNKGLPAIAATAKPGAFTGRGVVRASRAGAPNRVPSGTGGAVSGTNARTSRGTGIEERRSVNVAPRNERSSRQNQPRPAPEQRGLTHQPSSPSTAPHTTVAPRNERSFRQNESRPAPEQRGLAHQPSSPNTAPHTTVAPRNERSFRQNESRPAPEQRGLTHQPSAPRTAPQRPERQPQREPQG